MATILEFPVPCRSRSENVSPPADGVSAQILLFTGVRYERHAEAPAKPARATRKKKQAARAARD